MIHSEFLRNEIWGIVLEEVGSGGCFVYFYTMYVVTLDINFGFFRVLSNNNITTVKENMLNGLSSLKYL